MDKRTPGAPRDADKISLLKIKQQLVNADVCSVACAGYKT